MSQRVRLDIEVASRGLAESRARAQAIIMGGGVTVDGQVVTRPSQPVTVDSVIALVHEPMPYVSRGGLKLRHALDEFEIKVQGVVAADIGASTGGFTDVLLQAGAARVYAIDVGYGQLAWTLRNDPRVVVMERTNIRYVESLPERPTVAAIDTSFISLRQVLPPVQALLAPDSDAVSLIKPQFEAGKRRVGKGGVVRDPAVWKDVLTTVLTFAMADGWRVIGLTRSPISGPAGNIEFLAHLSLDRANEQSAIEPMVAQVVDGARGSEA
jgi:23S rRNA (cytidine1920-2'-O)/16S rRNA (cytidine1409-2'-O)-methyltransferase